MLLFFGLWNSNYNRSAITTFAPIQSGRFGFGSFVYLYTSLTFWTVYFITEIKKQKSLNRWETFVKANISHFMAAIAAAAAEATTPIYSWWCENEREKKHTYRTHIAEWSRIHNSSWKCVEHVLLVRANKREIVDYVLCSEFNDDDHNIFANRSTYKSAIWWWLIRNGVSLTKYLSHTFSRYCTRRI